MEFNLKEGMEFSKEKLITNSDTASKYASGSIEVFATPAMIALMEDTCKNCTQDILTEGFSTVGIEVNIKHRKELKVSFLTGNN